MVVFLGVVIGLLATGLLTFAVYAFTIGGVGAAMNCTYERCPRCGHHGLVQSGQLHAEGCPPPSATIRAIDLLHSGQERMHLHLH